MHGLVYSTGVAIKGVCIFKRGGGSCISGRVSSSEVL